MTNRRPNWKILRTALLERSGGLCEISGRPLDPDTFDAHHRRNKGMGGDRRPNRDSLVNLLALDPDVHNGGPTSVHGRRSWSEVRGYLVPKHVDQPGAWPVWVHPGLWVILLSDGDQFPLRNRKPPSEGRLSAGGFR